MTMPQVKFDWSFNFGHVITLVGFLLAATGAYYGIKSELAVVEQKVGALGGSVVRVEITVEKLTTIVADNARQDERIAALSARVSRLESAVERLPASR